MTTTSSLSLIPHVFRDYAVAPRWVDWRAEDGNKVPYIAGTRRRAKIIRPEDLRVYAQCSDDRRGIVFNGDGLGGVDLDGCRYPDGRLTDWAADLVKRFNSYAEVSPSGTGVKIFVRGCPATVSHHLLAMTGDPIGAKAPQVEAFVTARYFTVTGDHLAGTPEQINEAPEAWAALMETMNSRSADADGSDIKRQGRNGALYSLYCKMRKKGLSPTEAAAVMRAENRPGNVALHTSFADGALGEREVDGIIKHAERRQTGSDDEDQRVLIQKHACRLHQQADAAEDALVAAQVPVYTQGGFLVRSVVEQADAARGRRTLAARIVPCDRDWLLRLLSQEVRCVKYRQTQDGPQAVMADVPRQWADALLSSASVKFSELAGIIETPTLRPDGSILSQPGYDAATGLLLVNPPPMPVIPNEPTRHDAEQALQTLDKLLSEFPFADEASRSVALSALVTPVVRGALSFAPLHVATAPIAGSGKSFLFDTAAAIATGKECPVLSAGANSEETEKRLHGAALSGQPLISIDNLNGVLRGDFLCQLTTQALVEVRRLGSTGNFRIRNCATVFANGNNIEIEGDLVRRTIRCSLNPKMENPEAREFRGNPFRTVLADRGKFVAAALTLVRAHLVANEPTSVKPLAGFEDWSRLVRAALVWVGCADPVGTQEGLRAEDPAVVALDLVMEAWAKLVASNRDKDKAFPVTELIMQNHNDLDRELRAATGTRDDQPLSAVRVGQFLKRHRGRVRRGAKVVAAYDAHTKRQTWQLVGWGNLVSAAPVAAETGTSGEGSNKVVALTSQRTESGKRATRKAGKAGEADQPEAKQWGDLPNRPHERF